MRNRDPHFLLAATLLHALAIGAVWTNASSLRTKEANFVQGPDVRFDFDIELEGGHAKPDVVPLRSLARPLEPLTGPVRLAPRAKAVDNTPNDSPVVETTQAPNASETAEVRPSEPTALAPTEAPIPGIDGQPIWALPGVLPAGQSPVLGGARAAPTAPVVPAPPPASTGPVAAVLDYLASGNPPKPTARIEPPLHFPAAGTLATALANEIRGSSTPPDSNGIYELIIDSKGQLISVQVLAADPRYRQEWDRVARAISQRFTGQTFPLPDSYARGSRIRVTVTSRLTMPDGTSRGIPTPMPTIPGLPDEHEIRIDAIDDRHREGNGKSGVPPTQLAAGLKFDIDLANIGAKPRRIVHARISAAPLARATSASAADPRR